MTYTEAVQKALNGDGAGFEFLYNATRNNKYYLALKYVKNEETAKDVLQEAYIRAWKNLDKLKDPEKFDSWLSQIIVNTAKNELEKRNHTPLDLRAEIGEEEDDTEIFDRAVSSWDNVPELEYTKEETRQLVHELIDSLSDEQRLVVIAFELEGLTTKEIAEQLDCSEATVKSRLRYGRNNIREKAEELQKKGYKLYSIAPVTLVLYLLRKDMVVFAAEPATQIALSECGKTVLKNTHMASSTAAKAAADTASAVKKIAFLSTNAGKAVAVVVLTAAVGGTAVGVIHHNNAVPADIVVQETLESEESPDASEAETMESTEAVTETETVAETVPETETAEETETVAQTTPETETEVASQAADLPGENRNGRYGDIPESVLPASALDTIYFYDEPVKTTCWIDDVEGTIYADFDKTQVIKTITYSVDGYNDVLYTIAVQANTGKAIAIYNGEYVVIMETGFDLWINGKSSSYD